MTAEVMSLRDWRRWHGAPVLSHSGVLETTEPPLLPAVDGRVRLEDIDALFRSAQEQQETEHA